VSLLSPEPATARAQVLVIGVGNPDRGDDAIGPLLLDRLRGALSREVSVGQVELLDAYQLQPEHALDLRGRRRSIVVDAAATGPAPFTHVPVVPDTGAAITTHSLSPGALAAVHQRLFGVAPVLTALAVRGEDFGLGVPLSTAGAQHLEAALAWLESQLRMTRAGETLAAAHRPCSARLRTKRLLICDGLTIAAKRDYDTRPR
jgi:hydrogenase maturation protease